MQIPDCYEAFRQDEARQEAWDAYASRLPVCVICGERIPEGQFAHESGGKFVCGCCMDELAENYGLVEVD